MIETELIQTLLPGNVSNFTYSNYSDGYSFTDCLSTLIVANEIAFLTEMQYKNIFI